MEVKEIKKKLKKSLDKQRYQHTLGVMYTAGCLAMANGYSIEKAMLAGLLHDCAKCLSTEKKIGLCVKKNIDITEVEISNPVLHICLAQYNLPQRVFCQEAPYLLLL